MAVLGDLVHEGANLPVCPVCLNNLMANDDPQFGLETAGGSSVYYCMI